MKREFVVITESGDVSYGIKDKHDAEPESFLSFAAAKKRAEELAGGSPGDEIKIFELTAISICPVSAVPSIATKQSTCPEVTAATELADKLEATTRSMAQECKVGMGLWNGHSNACLNAASVLRGVGVAFDNTNEALEAYRARTLTAETAAKWLNAIETNCWDLRCVDLPTGAGDADTGWQVIEHHMAAPKERVVGFGNSPAEAIADALKDNAETDAVAPGSAGLLRGVSSDPLIDTEQSGHGLSDPISDIATALTNRIHKDFCCLAHDEMSELHGIIQEELLAHNADGANDA